MEDQIKCPKCQSTQITADKKGFSGKKAVAGAVLTGGIGLLAGTIGSNKMKLTCLKCGHTFSPGEDYESVQKKNKDMAELNKNPGCVVVVIFVVFIVIALLARSCSGCNSGGNGNENGSAANINTPIVDSFSKYYTIEYAKETVGYIVGVYISDTSKIKEVNNILVNKYDSDKSKPLTVQYFNVKGLSETYLSKLDKLNDKDADKLFKHFIAQYNLNPSTNYDELKFLH